MSITDAALLHLPSPLTPALPVISSNFKSPLLMYNLLLVVLAVKYKSGKPSLLKSPTATPPPLYKNSRSIGLMESLSFTILLNVIPVLSEESLTNKVFLFLQERSSRQITAGKIVFIFITDHNEINGGKTFTNTPEP